MAIASLRHKPIFYKEIHYKAGDICKNLPPMSQFEITNPFPADPASSLIGERSYWRARLKLPTSLRGKALVSILVRAITEENVSESVKKILEMEESLMLYKSHIVFFCLFFF